MTNEWITTSKASQISGYHPERIRELLRERKIEGQKFGSIWQVNRISLIAYLEKMQGLGDRRGPKPKSQKP